VRYHRYTLVNVVQGGVEDHSLTNLLNIVW